MTSPSSTTSAISSEVLSTSSRSTLEVTTNFATTIVYTTLKTGKPEFYYIVMFYVTTMVSCMFHGAGFFPPPFLSTFCQHSVIDFNKSVKTPAPTGHDYRIRVLEVKRYVEVVGIKITNYRDITFIVIFCY